MFKDLFTSSLTLKSRLMIALKMVVGFIGAFLVARLFTISETYAYTAGVIAVIGLDLTRKRAFQAAIIWLIDAMFAILLGVLLFWLMGYHFWVLIIFFAIFIPISIFTNLKDGIVIAIVLISQLYFGQNLSFAFNAFYVLLIGIMVALILNLYTPKSDKQINQSISQIDQTIDQVVQAICHDEPVSFEYLKKLIRSANDKLLHDIENHYFVQTSQREDYLKMRSRQVVVLENITPILETIPNIEQKATIITFMAKFKGRIGVNNYAKDLKVELDKLFQYFKEAPLPNNRQEFEHRAQLYHILKQLDEFLALKEKYHVIYN